MSKAKSKSNRKLSTPKPAAVGKAAMLSLQPSNSDVDVICACMDYVGAVVSARAAYDVDINPDFDLASARDTKIGLSKSKAIDAIAASSATTAQGLHAKAGALEYMLKDYDDLYPEVQLLLASLAKDVRAFTNALVSAQLEADRMQRQAGGQQ